MRRDDGAISSGPISTSAYLTRWDGLVHFDIGPDRFPFPAQGGLISPVIANMTLDGLEAAVDASVGPTERARRKLKVNVNRYADDFVVTGVSKEILEQNVLPAVRQFLAARGLELSEEKTRVTHIADGFDFLGQNVRKYAGKLLIKPANKSVKALLDKVREIVRQHRNATQTNLILQLNPVIRGWAMYHRELAPEKRIPC